MYLRYTIKLWQIYLFSHKHSLSTISICYSYIVHCGIDIFEAGYGRPGHKVQQVEFLGASTGRVVSNLIC